MTDSSTELEIETLPWQHELPELSRTAADSLEMPRLNAHQPGWISAITVGLGHRGQLIVARRDGQVVGWLPLIQVSGPLFGRFLVSLPYVNTGGVVCDDLATGTALVDAGCDLADRLNVKYLELRHETPLEHPRFNAERTDKVHMRLALPDSADAFMSSLKSKVRSQVNKSNQSGLTVEFGGRELLADFYDVFAVNMRDLGTPVYSRRLFRQILDQLEGSSEICVVRSEGRPAAAALLVHLNGVTEVPSASCLREFNRLNANMFMYQQLIFRAIERGSQTFDFGRSSESSGTYKFKKQWGALPCPATWQYYVRRGDPSDMRPDAGNKQRLVKIWQRLPVWLTRLIGPSIVRGIP